MNNKKGYTAKEVASLLLGGTGLSEWHERIGRPAASR
jgi:hypothetical protein